MICTTLQCSVSFWKQLCGAVQCGVTNKKYLRAADTKFCIRDIILQNIRTNLKSSSNHTWLLKKAEYFV